LFSLPTTLFAPLIHSLPLSSPDSKDAGKKEPSYTAGGNVSLYNHFGKQYGSFSKN
jgi:hypothetical protein